MFTLILLLQRGGLRPPILEPISAEGYIALISAVVVAIGLISSGIGWYLKSSLAQQLLTFQVNLFEKMDGKYAQLEDVIHLRNRVERHIERLES
jgi:hypothetical protein